MIDGLSREVDVEIRPVKVAWTWTFDLAQGRDRGIPKPRELRERDESLTVVQEQPEAMPRNVGYLSG
jgi:hypothetical protein